MVGNSITVIITSELAGSRLDRLKPKGVQTISRARFQSLIRSGLIKVNGIPVKPSYILKENDLVDYLIPDPVKLEITPQKLSIAILYEDHDVVIIDKPRGMVVHPGAGIDKNTVVNALLYYCQDLSGIGGVSRPGIVHRLDKGTSGVMIVAKNDSSHLALSRQFSSRSMGKRYLALVKGTPNWREKAIAAPIGRHPTHRVKMAVTAIGKPAETLFKLLAQGEEGSLLAAEPTSGRTHQIRVHLDYLGFPILGDPLYGKGLPGKTPVSLRNLLKKIDGFCLHAESLIFQHPTTGKCMKVHAPIPDDFQQVMEELHMNNLKT